MRAGRIIASVQPRSSSQLKRGDGTLVLLHEYTSDAAVDDIPEFNAAHHQQWMDSIEDKVRDAIDAFDDLDELAA